jgi:hypothetical protein
VSPPIPLAPANQPARDAVTVTADITIDPAGQVVQAEIKSGSSPWSEALLQALRTWRFTPTGGERMVTFEVRADFMTGGRGAPRVELKLSDLRQGDAPAAAEGPPPPEPPAAPGTPAPNPEASSAAPPAAQPPSESSAPATPATAPPTSSAAATAPDERPGTEAPARPIPPDDPARLPPNTPATASLTTTPSAAETPAPPAVEIIPPAPVPPKPVEPGVSAVQDVVLGPGVPDLSKGRRPVAPPIARMNSVSGNVEVRFVVEASGASSVRDVVGPELLKEAARQTVSSWMFRRTTPERLPLVAVFSYLGDGATASVKVVE